MTQRKPRDYQAAACDHLWAAVHNSPEENPLVIMPTGTGKSYTMALFISGLLLQYPSIRIASVVHVKELIEGNYQTLIDTLPAAPAGVYSSGLKRWETRQITFCGIDSIYNKADLLGKIDFLLVDEAHRISDKDKTKYGRFIGDLREKNPNLVVVGFTATGFRLGQGMLTEGDHPLFDRVVFDLSDGDAFVWMVKQGYLIRPVPKRPSVEVDSSMVRIQSGEFKSGEAAAAFEEQDILVRAVDEIIQSGQDRRKWLIFAQSIEHTELISDMFADRGYNVPFVHSKIPGGRDEVIKAFKNDPEVRGLVNKDILTTGFDFSGIDLIGALRMTNSPGLWVQMVGRGTRPIYAPGFDITTQEGRLQAIENSYKHDCLVLDFAGNTRRLGPINYPSIPKHRKKGLGGQAPVRECPQCHELVHISLAECPGCGYEFPREIKIGHKASEVSLVLDEDPNNFKPPEKEYGIFPIQNMVATEHHKKGVADTSMRVDYFCGIRRFSTWVFFEKPMNSFPWRRSSDWWKLHGGKTHVPATTAEAIKRFAELTPPKFIKVWLNTKYPEIEAYDFTDSAFKLPDSLGGGIPFKIAEGQCPAQIAGCPAKESDERADALLREMFNDE